MTSSLPDKKYFSPKLLGLLSLVWVIFIMVVPWQTQDGPNHQKVAVILSRLATSPIESQVYQSNLGFFQTNELFPLAYKIIHGWLPSLSIQNYEKLFVGFSILLLWWSYLYFLKVWSPQSQKLFWIVLPLSFHLLFVQGMYNFMLSVPLSLLALTWMRRGMETGRLRYLLLFTPINYLAFLAHPFPSFILGPSLFFLTLSAKKNQRLRLLPYWIITLFFFSIGFLLPLFQESGTTSAIPYQWKMPWENLGGLFAFNFPIYSIPQALGLIPFFLLLVFLGVRSLRQAPWKNKIYWLSFLLLYFIFPNEGKGGAHLNLRFLPFVWLFLPLGLEATKRLSRITFGLSLMTMLYLGVSVSWAMDQLNQQAQAVRSITAYLPKGQAVKLYPINFNVHGPTLNYTSQMHLWAHYPEDRLVFSPYLFAFSHLMPLSKRADSSIKLPATPEDFAKEIPIQHDCLSKKYGGETFAQCQQVRQAAWEAVFQQAQNYDYWWIYQAPKDFLEKLSKFKNLSLIIEKGDHSLWRYKKDGQENKAW